MKIYAYKGRCNVSGVHVRRLRESMRLTQEQLAARLQIEGVQINQKAVSRIESGLRIVTDYELKALAAVLNVDPSSLLAGAED